MWTLLLASKLALAAPANLVLITLDTTRADALGPVTTPTLMSIAEQGVRLEHFWANAPTTLSSHSTLFTGQDPHGHGVVRNGTPLPADIPTLAERLSSVGYDAHAVVGAAALEHSMGLDRGFAHYDDANTTQQGLMVQRSASQVTQAALASVSQRDPGTPLFLWVHYFDAHAPYAAPPPFNTRFVDPHYQGPLRGHAPGSLPAQLDAGTATVADLAYARGSYLGEVAYVDAQVGRLLDGLSTLGVLDHALLVIVGDHGETLDEDPPIAFSHGSDVDPGAMHIPLILRGFGVPLARGVVVRQAAMAHLPATIEQALGLPPTLGTGAWDLVRPGPLWDQDGWPERPTLPVRYEATRPRQYEDPERWNNLPLPRGLRAGGWAVRAAPCFDLPLAFDTQVGAREPAEAVGPWLRAMLMAWDSQAPPHRDVQLAPQTRRALQELGYQQ